MSLSDILTKCRHPDGQTRNKAELEIDALAESNFGSLMEACGKQMADENWIKENRQLCSILIKNMIRAGSRHEGKWEQLPTDPKLNIKNSVLSCLASNIKDVRKAAALAVAAISKWVNRSSIDDNIRW